MFYSGFPCLPYVHETGRRWAVYIILWIDCVTEIGSSNVEIYLVFYVDM